VTVSGASCADLTSALQNEAIGTTKTANGGTVMPTMSDARRKRIQAKQRKATNALQRAAKVAKRKRNAAEPGTAALRPEG